MTAPVVTTTLDDGVLTLTLNRPAASNALSLDMAEAIYSAITSAPCPRLAVIKGNGKNFCAGFDLSDVEALSDADLLWRFLRIETMLQAVHHAPFPTIALAQGHIIGAGADLFAACSYRIAAPEAKLRFPGWNFGLALGTRRLERLIGKDAALDILLDGRIVLAQEAKAVRLATQIADQSEWPKTIETLAARTAQMSAFSTQQMRSIAATNTRAQDIASVVATAGRPGLRGRILDYQRAVKEAREKRRQS